MRADARRNRERLLASADAVFAEEGVAASTEEVARRAGVGIGTVFRHFPTKVSLLEAVFVARLRRLVDTADELAAADQPGPAFFAFLDSVLDQQGEKRAFSDALIAAGVDVDDATASVKEDLQRIGDGLLRRAQQAGAVRMDIGTPELMVVLAGLSGIAEHARGDPDVRDRAVRVLVDGLRPR
ncbi:TetR/AcrR family transcriptional regulator [Pseudonocardia acaciae]|uniref:TetR/AcrR family transcriptional regulator n=1 Tax=Pseudonocardia acaciae TaxID=551276 RepID=UPI001FE162E6|nr:TetR/AcrR family transcriptional regulator [Pseudonocardia acaciae]